jgi:hypothetical protein
MKAHYAVYSIPKAAALWCGVPEDMLDTILSEVQQFSSTGFGRSIWTHPAVPCLEPRSRAIAEAIESGELPHGREDGGFVQEDHVAYERRHFSGRDLKSWMEKAFPNEKPAFLFDDLERNTHPSISADAYRALKAEHDKLEKLLENAKVEIRKIKDEQNTLELENKSLRATVETVGAPGERAEATYRNIIAALLDCFFGKVPGIDGHPTVPNEAKLIEIISQHYQGYRGLSQSNLSRKFPEAKKSILSE